MAIPQKPLVIADYDPDELSLGESHTLFGDTYAVDDFRQFLIDHIDHATSWSLEEIDAIKRSELGEVRRQLFEKIVEAEPKSAPLAKPPRSKGGRG